MLAACMLAAAPMAQAAPRDPVLDLLGAVTANYRPGSRGHEDYFGDTRLDSIYSRAFAASFRAAWNRVMEDDEGIFEGDILTGADDGCPLADIALTDKADGTGGTLVDARFKPLTCLRGRPEADRTVHLVFKVIRQDDRDVIDDIVRIGDDGRERSVRAEMDGFHR